MPTIYERMKVIVSDKLDVNEDAVVPGASFVDDLDADSLDLAELIMAFEEEFSDDENRIEISDEDAGKIITLQDAIDYLKQHKVQDT
ncbi:MAG: acyl carrier protein [Dehalococcoidia bacterium]|nr:acyl carrier protein [Dehalococcoidia bacterium]